jgi:hypothetical protein
MPEVHHAKEELYETSFHYEEEFRIERRSPRCFSSISSSGINIHRMR